MQVAYAERAGAAAVVVINFEDLLMSMGGDDVSNPRIPAMHIPSGSGQTLKETLAAAPGARGELRAVNEAELAALLQSTSGQCVAGSGQSESSQLYSSPCQPPETSEDHSCLGSAEGQDQGLEGEMDLEGGNMETVEQAGSGSVCNAAHEAGKNQQLQPQHADGASHVVQRQCAAAEGNVGAQGSESGVQGLAEGVKVGEEHGLGVSLGGPVGGLPMDEDLQKKVDLI